MRIAVGNNFYPPRVGGSSHLSSALAEAYAAKGHEVVVLTAAYQGAPELEELNGVTVHRLPAHGLPQVGLSIDFDITFTLGPRNLRRVFRVLDEFKPDVIHQHGQFLDLAWLTGWYARKRDIPVLLSVHTRLESFKWFYAKVFKGLDRFLVRPILKSYRPRYVIMDELVAAYCTDRYDASADSFDYIPVAVDPIRFTGPPTKDIRAELGLGDAPLIVSLGHVIPLRDRLCLVNAMPKVLEKYPDTKVLVVGHVYYDAFQERARELGLSESFISVGVVPKADVPSYFAAADIEAHDLVGIGCGTASLEAIAAGKVTVAAVTETNFPGIRLRNWDNAVLIRPDDAEDLATALIRLLDDPQERAAIGARQQELVLANFTMDVVTEQHLTVFEKMLLSRPVRIPSPLSEPELRVDARR